MLEVSGSPMLPKLVNAYSDRATYSSTSAPMPVAYLSIRERLYSIRKSIAVNRFNNIQVFEILLGNHDGIGELYLTSHAVHASIIPRENTFDKVTLPICKVDTLVASGRCPPPDIIKMDTEGAELQILDP
jgi:FkbM family methyltransferase